MAQRKENVGSSVMALTISKMLTLLLSVAVSMVLSRYLTRNDYGTYSELQTVTSLVMSIFALGLPNSLNYFLPTCTAEEKKSYLGFYYTAITLLSVIIGVVMILSRGFLSRYYKNPDIALYSVFLAVIPWTKLAISSRSNMLVVEAKIRREFVYCIGNALCLFLLSVYAAAKKSSFGFYINAYAAIEGVYAALVYGEAVMCGGGVKFGIDPAFLKRVLVFSVPLGVSTAISAISLDLDKLIIGRLMDTSAVAVYANAGKELPFTYISSSFTAVILPKIVKHIKDGDTDRALGLWKNAAEMSFLVLSFCAAACIVFAPQIICVLYSEKYLTGVGIFRIYSMVLLLRMTYWGMILNAYGKSKQILYNSIMCLVLNMFLSVLLYYVIGFAGPALATFLSILAMAAIQLLHSVRLTDRKISKIFPWRSMLFISAGSAATAAVAYIGTKVLKLGTDNRSIGIAILIGMVWAVLYFLLYIKRMIRIWNELKEGSE